MLMVSEGSVSVAWPLWQPIVVKDSLYFMEGGKKGKEGIRTRYHL